MNQIPQVSPCLVQAEKAEVDLLLTEEGVMAEIGPKQQVLTAVWRRSHLVHHLTKTRSCNLKIN